MKKNTPFTHWLLINPATEFAISPTGPANPPKNPAIIPGNKRTESAKMTGITPAGLTFKGRYVETPPNILLPRTLLAYETGIFLRASVISTTPAIIATDNAKNKRYEGILLGSQLMNVWKILVGRLATIPAKINNEMPLPMPCSVMISPIHIKNIEPATIVIMELTITSRGKALIIP